MLPSTAATGCSSSPLSLMRTPVEGTGVWYGVRGGSIEVGSVNCRASGSPSCPYQIMIHTEFQLVTNLGYTGPLEFLTMFLCLSQDQVIRRLTSSNLPSDIFIRQMIQDHKRRHHMTPNPAVLLESLLNDSPCV